MTTYSAAAVSDTVIAHEKGITLQQGRALRDNPLAQAEGASGAPKIQGIALDNLWLGLQAAETDAGRIKILYVQSTGTAPEKVRFSTDGGATYGSNITFSIGTSWTFLYANLNTGNFTFSDGTVDSITIPAGMDALQFRGPSAVEPVFMTVIAGLV